MQKKFTLFLTGLLVYSGVSFAKNQPSEDLAGKFNLQEVKSLLSEKDNEEFRNHMETSVSTRADVLTDVIYHPVGKAKPYTKMTTGLDWGSPFEEETATSIVFGENNEVYIRNLIVRAASIGYGSYAKGEIVGNEIHVPVPQTLTAYDGGWGRNIALMKKSDNGEFVVADLPYITYSYDEKTGVIKSELPGNPNEYAIGLVWSFDDSWNEIGDFTQVYTPYDGDFITVPEGVKMEEFLYNDGFYGYPLEVGIDGNDLYISGMSLNAPEVVLKATIDGNQAVIPQNELLGSVMGYFIWTKILWLDPVNEVILAPESVSYILDVDLENKIIKSHEPSAILALNCEYDRVFYLEYFINFKLETQDSYAGTPRNPFGISFDGDEFRDFYGLYGFNFNISNISIEGSVLNINGLSYSIYIDGEILEFEEEEGLYNIIYPGIDGVVTRIPFDFSNGYDINIQDLTQRFVGIYPDGLTTIGVQAIYNYNGIETCSDIVTLNVETNEITEEAGIETIYDADVIENRFFDLNGRRIANPSSGVYIRQATLSNGKTLTSKVIVK